MRILKRHSLLNKVNTFVIDSPLPSNISYMWNFGSLLAMCLIIQIVTGVTLAMHYNASVLEAFNTVEHIMRDVNNGWLIRYLHSNTASAFFFLVYLHIGRGLYYGSYKAPRSLTWTIGTIILVVMMATAFLGYVLPYGQMSLWGATVITNLLSAIPWVGQDIVEFVWGGFSVNNATLNRFFALHFVLPFVLAALALMHLIALHDTVGANNPLGISSNCDRLPFAPYFIFKDLITIFLFIVVLSGFVFFMPNVLGDSENYVTANPMQTPPAIVPEWYLLPFYAILRSIPNKLLGVIAMFSAILILLVMPYTDLSKYRGVQFRPLSKVAFFVFVANFLILMLLGARHVESPYIEFGQISTVLYFAHFFIIVPGISLLENSLLVLYSDSSLNETSTKPIFHPLSGFLGFLFFTSTNSVNTENHPFVYTRLVLPFFVALNQLIIWWTRYITCFLTGIKLGTIILLIVWYSSLENILFLFDVFESSNVFYVLEMLSKGYIVINNIVRFFSYLEQENVCNLYSKYLSFVINVTTKLWLLQDILLFYFKIKQYLHWFFSLYTVYNVFLDLLSSNLTFLICLQCVLFFYALINLIRLFFNYKPKGGSHCLYSFRGIITVLFYICILYICFHAFIKVICFFFSFVFYSGKGKAKASPTPPGGDPSPNPKHPLPGDPNTVRGRSAEDDSSVYEDETGYDYVQDDNAVYKSFYPSDYEKEKEPVQEDFTHNVQGLNLNRVQGDPVNEDSPLVDYYTRDEKLKPTPHLTGKDRKNEAKRLKRLNETPEEKEKRLQDRRDADKRRKEFGVLPKKPKSEVKQYRENQKKRRSEETPEQREIRLTNARVENLSEERLARKRKADEKYSNSIRGILKRAEYEKKRQESDSYSIRRDASYRKRQQEARERKIQQERIQQEARDREWERLAELSRAADELEKRKSGDPGPSNKKKK